MKYIYDAQTNSFYPYANEQAYRNAGLWPEFGIGFDEDDFIYWSPENAPAGKVRVGGIDGNPSWVNIPPPTQEQLSDYYEQMKKTLRSSADMEIMWRQDAVDAGIATPEEAAALEKWIIYRIQVMRVNTANPVWPELPVA